MKHSQYISVFWVVFACAFIYTTVLAVELNIYNVPIWSIPTFVLGIPAIAMYSICAYMVFNYDKHVDEYD